MRVCDGPERGADGSISSCIARGVEAKSGSKHEFAKALLLRDLSFPRQHCCSSSVRGFRCSLPARSGSVVWIFTEFLAWQARLRPAQLPGGLCSGALVVCAGRRAGCISCVQKDLFKRKKWLLPFSTVAEQIVCVSVCVCACIF